MKPKSIPISALKAIGKQFKQNQVIMMTWDGEGRTHVVTWGRTKIDCKQAAQGGNLIKKTLGFPENV